MTILSPLAGHMPALYALYLKTVAQAAHCRFTPDLERFSADLLRTSDTTEILVAEEQGAVLGFAAFTKLPKSNDEDAPEAITALFSADDQAGYALIAACEARASTNKLMAFPGTHERCPVAGYNAGWDALTDRAPQIARMLVRAGYKPSYRELHLSADLTHNLPDQPPVPADVSIIFEQDQQGYFIQRALIGEQKVGICYYNTVGGVTKLPGKTAAQVGYVGWLHVEESARRRSIARLLMLRALQHLRETGCDECWLTTGAENWPAQPLYLSLGFEIVDSSAAYLKTLRS